MIPRIIIDSSDAQTELCFIGKAVGTDKSPYNTVKHRHPYTAVYNILLSPYKNRPVQFAEIGVAAGNSCFLWDTYFTNADAKIHMFDRDADFLTHGKSLVANRFTFSLMDVAVDGDVVRALKESNTGEYDVIIDDSSHEHGHQIRIIKEAFPLLKQGGLLIVEDIFRSTPEDDYTREIKDILDLCSAYYFVICEHKDRWSPGWDNDKLLVLVKG